ncbi:chromate transporter [Gracilibacillus alcaliphilus]|uniref:chromate transporter n=1 Tax=Gracilibacillus alcaliphilus TaxID=1401441 RepID=UPI00195E959F|nr:chromate transporter [Gracilibacillus alcaliphilus]MBM7677675.1 chromate transporter [Gracilibacillus alcaliphilus]
MGRNRKYLGQIFLAFLKIAPATFGGGYAMIPLMEKEVVEKRKWINPQEIGEIFAIAQSVPGAIAINSAIFIGYRLAGVLGAIAAMIGILLPTFLIVIALSILFIFVKDNPYMEAAFTGIRAAVVAMILFAAYKIGLTAVYDKTTLVIMIVTAVILLFLQVHPVAVILAGIALGIVIVKVKEWFGYATQLEKDEDK